MLSAVPIPFGEWRPDMAPHMSPALAEATNVLPIAGAYGPFPAHVQVAGTGLPSAAKGFFPGILNDGSPAIYAATRSAIYRITNSSIVLAYNAAPLAADRWWFAQVGGKLCMGADGQVPLGGDLGGTIAPLGGTPPAAAVGAVVNRDYLVLGNLTGEPVDGAVANRVRWSGSQNPDTWGTSVATGADFEDMHDEGGPVVQITGRTFGTVFQRRGITRMQPTGNSSTVFSFTTVELGRGAVSAGAVCDVGALVFYRADDGFFAWDGTQSIPIGTDRVDDWFISNADSTKVDMMRSGYDPVHRCVMWAFAKNGSSINNAILAYSLADTKFTLIDLAMQDLGASATLPASIETMPTPDSATISWDDGVYAGKRPILGGIDAANTYGTFSGAAMASTIVTGDFQSAPGKRTFVGGVRPIIDASGVLVAVGEREQATKDTVVWNAATALGVDGICPQRFDARYLRYRQTTPAAAVWTRSSGIEAHLKAGGSR
jgi:hypothetical protein